MKVITTRSSGLSILPRLFGLRSLSEIHLGASEADVEDVIERNLVMQCKMHQTRVVWRDLVNVYKGVCKSLHLMFSLPCAWFTCLTGQETPQKGRYLSRARDDYTKRGFVTVQRDLSIDSSIQLDERAWCSLVRAVRVSCGLSFHAGSFSFSFWALSHTCNHRHLFCGVVQNLNKHSTTVAIFLCPLWIIIT